MDSFADYDAMVRRFFPEAPGWVRVDMIAHDLDVVYKTRSTGIGELTTTMTFARRSLVSLAVVFDKAWGMEYATDGITLCKFSAKGPKVICVRFFEKELPIEPVLKVPRAQWAFFQKAHHYHRAFFADAFVE